MTRAERTAWLQRPVQHRNRFACVGSDVSRSETEAQGLREVIYELLSEDSLTSVAITAGVHEHWGDATPRQISRALTELQRSGAIRRVGERYSRSET